MWNTRHILRSVLTTLGLAALWLGSFVRFRDETGVLGLYTVRGFLLSLGVTCVALATTYVALGAERCARRVRLRRVLLASFSLALCVGVLELPAALGWIDYRLVLPVAINPDDRENPRCRLEPERIHAHLPNDRFVGRVQGNLALDYGLKDARLYEVDVRYDRNGFRNESDIEQADVVVIGDSFAEAALVPVPCVASSLLAESLSASVLNLGHIAYGPQQELVVLKRHGLPAKPKVVVWIMYEGNDLSDFVYFEGTMAHWDEHVAARHSFARRSWTRNLLQSLPKVRWTPRVDPEVGRRHSALLKANGERMYFRDSGAALTPGQRRALAGTQDVFQEASRLCADQGVRFVLAFAPIKYRVYRNLIDAESDSEVAGWPEPNDLPERLAQWCVASGIPFLDLTPGLTDASRRGTLTYFLDDTHWTRGGNAAAAGALHELISARHWLR